MVQPLPSATLSAFCKEREEALAKDFRVSYLAYQVKHPLPSHFIWAIQSLPILPSTAQHPLLSMSHRQPT